MAKFDSPKKRPFTLLSMNGLTHILLLLPQASIAIFGIQPIAKPATVEHVVNDIILALLANGFIVIHLCQNALITYAAINTVNARLHAVGIKNKLRTVIGIPLLPSAAQKLRIGIAGAHKGSKGSQKGLAQLLGASSFKGIALSKGIGLVAHERQENTVQSAIARSVGLAHYLVAVTKIKGAHINIIFIMRIQFFGSLLTIEQAVQLAAIFISKAELACSNIILEQLAKAIFEKSTI